MNFISAIALMLNFQMYKMVVYFRQKTIDSSDFGVDILLHI